MNLQKEAFSIDRAPTGNHNQADSHAQNPAVQKLPSAFSLTYWNHLFFFWEGQKAHKNWLKGNYLGL